MLAAAFACVSCTVPEEQKESPRERDAREVFEQWRKAFVEGRWDGVYAGMSLRMKTLWLWGMHGIGDEGLKKAMEGHRRKLPKELRDEYDDWRGRNVIRKEERVEILPVSILQGAWLKDLLSEHFTRRKKPLAEEFRQVKILQVFADESGVSVLIENYRKDQELYSLVEDPGGWKVDGHIYSGLPGRR
ncbi:MAG: hypothetical protein ACYTAF_00775 [Planctomycetota bacterium]